MSALTSQFNPIQAPIMIQPNRVPRPASKLLVIVSLTAVVGCAGNCDPRSGGIIGGIAGLTGCYQAQIDSKARDVELTDAYGQGLGQTKEKLTSDIVAKREQQASLLKSARDISNRTEELRKRAQIALAATPDRRNLADLRDQINRLHQKNADLQRQLVATNSEIEVNKREIADQEQQIQRLEYEYQQLAPTK